MKFTKALKLLNKGERITRKFWGYNYYLEKYDNWIRVKGIVGDPPLDKKWEPTIDELLTEDWEVHYIKEFFDFEQVLNHLRTGKKVRRNPWPEGVYLYLDSVTNAIRKNYGEPGKYVSVDNMRWSGEFEDFTTTDWEIFE